LPNRKGFFSWLCAGRTLGRDKGSGTNRAYGSGGIKMPKNAKDINAYEDNIKAYILGSYGTGKSVFAASFPTPGYVFDFDQGIKTYRGLNWDYDIYPLTAQGWVLFDKMIKEVEKAVNAKEYKTVVLDSTTSMTDCAMSRAMQIDPKRSDEGGPIWNVHFQIVKNLVEPKLKRLLSLDCNVIMTGHWNITLDPKTGNIISIDPLLTGQLSQKVPGYFDEVYCASVGKKDGKDVFFIRTTTWGHYRSRSRLSGKLGLLPSKLPNDYTALMESIKKAEKMEREDEANVQKA
jgi:hypothetical protein